MELGSLGRIDRISSAALGMLSKRQCVASFVGFCERLQAILETIDAAAAHGGEFPAVVATALEGIERELERGESVLEEYKTRSQFFVLTHCHALTKTMEDLTRSLGKWISLLELGGMSEIKRRIEDLSMEMQHSIFQVTDAEERSLDVLDKELKQDRYDSVVVGVLWRDLARLIGVELTNTGALEEQVHLLKKELTMVNDGVVDLQLEKMKKILKVVEHVAAEPQLTRMYSVKDSTDEEPMQPFDSFECPLTKQIMTEPVMIQSELTYERGAIEKWFKTCAAEGRPVTCPVTGMLLESTEMRSNIMLRHTIEEWSQRNAKIRIHKALSQISMNTASLGFVEEALDSILKVCDDGPIAQYRLGRTHFASSMMEFWRKKVEDGSQVRTKVLYILQRVASDDPDGQECLIQAGVLKASVRSLASSHVNEVESALKLFLEISRKPEFAALIGKEKGALIHLLSISSNSSGNASLSVLADSTLKNLEQIDSNVWEMAEAGRLDPLLTRLCKGPEATKIEMADYLAEKVFVNSQKEFVAKKAGKVLVSMLSASPKEKEAAIGALLNLSAFEETGQLLVKAGILPPVVDIILSVPTSSNRLRGTAKEKAATTLANIVAVAGSWEAVKIDDEGNSIQSEYFVHRILGLLSSVGPDWNSKLLKILIGVCSSSQAAEEAVKHIVSGNGIAILLTLLQASDDTHRQQLLHLLSILSARSGKEISEAIVQTRHLQSLKEIIKLKNGEGSIFAASIIANIPLTEPETIRFLGIEMIPWCVATIDEVKTRRIGSARLTSSMLESLLGLLLHFARCRDDQVIAAMKKSKLFSEFRDVLRHHHGQAWIAKQRAATGLGYLSEKGLAASPVDGPRPSRPRTNSMFSCFSGRRSRETSDSVCPFHRPNCDPDSNFCLREGGAVGLLVELLEDDEQRQVSVQIAAVEALSTLVGSDGIVEAGVGEIAKNGGVVAVMRWFQRLRPSSSWEAQEKGTVLVEKILRVEEHRKRYMLDQGVVRALVEAFKNGRSAAARKNAEAALAQAEMLSVASIASGGSSARPTNRRR